MTRFHFLTCSRLSNKIALMYIQTGDDDDDNEDEQMCDKP